MLKPMTNFAAPIAGAPAWLSPERGERREIQRLRQVPALVPLLHLIWALDGPPAPLPRWPAYDGDPLDQREVQLEAWARTHDELWDRFAQAERAERLLGADAAAWYQYRRDFAFMLRRREPVQDDEAESELEVLEADLTEAD